MDTSDFYSDRLNGPIPRTHDYLPEATSEGLFALFKQKVRAHWFAQDFPEQCEDGHGVVGTNAPALWANVRAVIPGLIPSRFGIEGQQADEVLFDLLEYAAQRVAKPVPGEWHPYMKHHELNFNSKAGRKKFRAEVNQILERGGTRFELNSELQIVRIGTPAVQQVLEQLNPASGDSTLDAYLVEARTLYQSPRHGERAFALERLWDAFERLKTLDVPRNKPASATVLLGNVQSEKFRAFVAAEMLALRSFGNDFMIRHHEMDKAPVPPESRDYLFARMGSLLVFLLKESKRLD